MNKNIKKLFIILIVILTSLITFSLNLKNVSAAPNRWLEPADVKLVTNEVLNSPIDPRTTETYKPSDRIWQGLPSVVKFGNRLWAVYQTGGSSEPVQYNYAVITYSDDNGETWVDPYIVVDHSDPEQSGVNITIPNFWVYDGDLYLQYMQSGMWMVKFHNADSKNIKDVTWDTPVRTGNIKIHKVPTEFTDSDGKKKLICAVESEYGDQHITQTKFFVSEDKGYSWKYRSEITSSFPSNRTFPETQIVETKTGKLIAVSRLEKGKAGGMEVSYSLDHGYTWSKYEANLSEPYWGPGSKVDIQILKSGNILMINHATTSSRSIMTAYLSTNDGETFDYSLTLDPRTDVSYPYAYQDDDGLIYASWDKGRYKEKEVRLSIFTEEDIIAGDFVSENSKSMIKVAKVNSTYKEITELVTEFDNYIEVEYGTSSDSIKEDLPKTIKVKDNNGKEYTLTGTWKSSGYRQYVPDSYYFTFNTDLPMNLADNYLLLRIKIVVKEKEVVENKTTENSTTKKEETNVANITTNSNSVTKITENTTNENKTSGCNGSITSLLTMLVFVPFLGVFVIKKNKE